MAIRPTRRQIDEMIETCIKAVNEGKRLSQEQKEKFAEIIMQVRLFKGIPRSESFKNSQSTYADSPQGYLINAMNLGIIKQPKHQRFIAEAEALIRMESSLLSLGHMFPAAFRELAQAQQGKPMQERWAHLSRLSGVDFSKLFDLAHRHSSARNAIVGIKDKTEKERLKRREKRINRQMMQELNRVVSDVKGRLAAKFAQPNHRARLVEALRDPRDELTNRDMGKLWRNLEAFDRHQAKQKPIPRRRPRRI